MWLNSKYEGGRAITMQGLVGWRRVGCATVHLLGRLLSCELHPCEAGNPARRVALLLLPVWDTAGSRRLLARPLHNGAALQQRALSNSEFRILFFFKVPLIPEVSSRSRSFYTHKFWPISYGVLLKSIFDDNCSKHKFLTLFNTLSNLFILHYFQVKHCWK